MRPPDDRPLDDYLRVGDIATLLRQRPSLRLGHHRSRRTIVTDQVSGEMATVAGRDLVGQLEDHDAVSLDSRAHLGDPRRRSTAYLSRL
jgi:hypothetical protein